MLMFKAFFLTSPSGERLFSVGGAWILDMQDLDINHIMNETGATVELRGRDSGNLESLHGEGGQEPLHLFLSSNSLKNLDDAKLLAENLLDTICAECGAFRVSSRKAYGAVPPLQQLLNGVHSSVNEIKANAFSAAGSISSAVGPSAVPAPSSSIPGAFHKQFLHKMQFAILGLV